MIPHIKKLLGFIPKHRLESLLSTISLSGCLPAFIKDFNQYNPTRILATDSTISEISDHLEKHKLPSCINFNDIIIDQVSNNLSHMFVTPSRSDNL